MIAPSDCPFEASRSPDYGRSRETGSEFRVPIYTADFAADPHGAYKRMWERFGSLAPVWLAPGVPATLVVGYWTALGILNDPEYFPADPSVWQRGIPLECPVRPMMEKRPNALRSSGAEHARYRAATVNLIDQAVYQVLTRPELLRQMRTGTVTWSQLVDETLRYAPPVANLPLRYAIANIDIADVHIKAGEAIIAAIAAANRNPDWHEPDPDAFDPARPNKEHLSFGYGPHHCLGAALAAWKPSRPCLPCSGASPNSLSLSRRSS